MPWGLFEKTVGRLLNGRWIKSFAKGNASAQLPGCLICTFDFLSKLLSSKYLEVGEKSINKTDKFGVE